MIQDIGILENLLPLTSIEELCKQFLTKYPNKHTMDGQELRAFLEETMSRDDSSDVVSVLTEGQFDPCWL